MPRTVGHQGRAGYPPLIDERWTDHLIPAASHQFTCMIEIHGPATPGVFDQNTGTRPMVPGALLFASKGRVESIGDDSTVEVAGQAVTTRAYKIGLEYGSPALSNGMIARVTQASESDIQLINAEFVIISHVFNSLRWQTEVIAEHWEG